MNLAFDSKWFAPKHIAKLDGMAFAHNVQESVNALFPGNMLAEIILQTFRVFHEVASDLAQQVARLWSAGTFWDCRVALFPRAQVPILWAFKFNSVVHSFFTALSRRDVEGFSYPKRARACESCSLPVIFEFC
jgi:hypothetical protein